MTQSIPENRPPTALITGGAIRIGRALAEICADLGYRLVIHYGSSHQAAVEFSQLLSDRGIDHCLVQTNLAEPDAACQLFEAIPERFKPVDLLINSAAVFPEDDDLFSLEQHWPSVMSINAKTPISLIHQLVQQSLASPLHVVNVIDARLEQAQSQHLVYRWSKAVLKQATLDLAKTLAPQVRVNAIALGAILPPPGKGEDHLQRLAQQIPLQRTGDLEQVKQALAYLVRQPFVTGEILRLDGGEFL
jgi:glucose 1-dehydrogenase